MELDEIVRIYHPVSDAGIDALQNAAELICFKKGDVIIKQNSTGDKSSSIYIIKSGVLRSFHEENGDSDTIWFATSGDLVASMHPFYANLPAIANIEALVNSTAYRISKKDFDNLLSESQELATWAYKIAIEAIFALERRYSYIGNGDAYMRYKRFMEMRQKEVIQQIPLKYIAEYLKIAPQTLSKLRKLHAKELCGI